MQFPLQRVFLFDVYIAVPHRWCLAPELSRGRDRLERRIGDMIKFGPMTYSTMFSERQTTLLINVLLT